MSPLRRNFHPLSLSCRSRGVPKIPAITGCALQLKPGNKAPEGVDETMFESMMAQCLHDSNGKFVVVEQLNQATSRELAIAMANMPLDMEAAAIILNRETLHDELSPQLQR